MGQLGFIISYDIEYRMGGEIGEPCGFVTNSETNRRSPIRRTRVGARKDERTDFAFAA